MKIRQIDQIAKKLRRKHRSTRSWNKSAVLCNVLTKDGRPDPAMAWRIAERGYEPKRLETRLRLGLSPHCNVCGQKVRQVRRVPPWVKKAMKNLLDLQERKLANSGH
jgi:hypothetical protein